MLKPRFNDPSTKGKERRRSGAQPFGDDRWAKTRREMIAK